MVKPNRGKTKTIKERAIYVYLPSLEMVEDWKSRADKAGISLSKFVIDRVEDSIEREEGEEGYLSRLELIKKLRDSEEEVKKLREENRLLKRLVENLDDELKKHRAVAQPVQSRNTVEFCPTPLAIDREIRLLVLKIGDGALDVFSKGGTARRILQTVLAIEWR